MAATVTSPATISSDHTEGGVPVDCCQLQVGVHTAPSHWYSLLLVLFVAWSVVLFGSPLGASD